MENNDVRIALRELSVEETFCAKLAKAGYEGNLANFPVKQDLSCVMLYVSEGAVHYNPISVNGRPIDAIKAVLRPNLADFAERAMRLREARRRAA
jgi:hypothetical protein